MVDRVCWHRQGFAASCSFSPCVFASFPVCLAPAAASDRGGCVTTSMRAATVELKGGDSMELELGLAPPNAASGELFPGFLGAPAAGAACGKREFGEAFGKATLPLFVRDEDGGDDDRARDGVNPDTGNKRKRLVGWPPVKSAHRRSSGGGAYVKVKMEGVPIGRKVDVSHHGSYDELLRTLARMFPSGNAAGAGGAEEEVAAVTSRHERRGRGHQYVVTYEDGEGDWLLVGDVPWEAFAKSVKRLKILS